MTDIGAKSSVAVVVVAIIFVSAGFFYSGGKSTGCCTPLPDIHGIDEGWSFRKAGEEDWTPATVPGCVHTDLFHAGRIEAPYYGCNEQDLQWIEDCDWEYRSTILVVGRQDDDSMYDLVFEGIDTYSDVYLNDSLVVSTDNMFREWRVDCTALLREGANILRVLIKSATGREKEISSDLPYQLPGGPRVFTRKAAYHYGWDWGPRFVTGGIWRPVRVERWKGVRILETRYSLVELQPDRADYEAEITLDVSRPETLALVLDIDGRLTPVSFASIDGCHIEDTAPSSSSSFSVDPSCSSIRFLFSIPQPELWWPSGMGEQRLYMADLRLLRDDGAPGDKNTLRAFDRKSIGIRTVSLVTGGEEEASDFAGMKPGPEKGGSPFYFRINGKPLFMKGANYIPRGSFHGDAASLRYEDIVTNAVESNMNMLRVWGGGIYEDDGFYDLCDRYGILVWQDFMFACAMYPGDEAFLENVRVEAIENVRRLARHPCVALWCGNNEIDEAWHNWGWQESFDSLQRVEVWRGYEALFHEILPEVVEKYGNGVPYHPSSPRFGRGDDRSLSEGDCHYWGVWHDGQPFEVLLEKTGRFMSEFGFQSFPDPATIAAFAPEEEPDEDSPSMSCHQKHPRGNSLIREYMIRDFPEPGDFDDLAYMSQLLQARGVSMGIEAQRRAAPFCMGSLYWQLNDCWPAVSWSSIDYTGRRKALYYAAKKAFAPVLISPVVEDGRFKVYIIDDESIYSAKDVIDGELIIETIDFKGLPRSETRVSGLVPATFGPCFETVLQDLCPPSGIDSTLIRLTLTAGTKTSPAGLSSARPERSGTIAETLFFPATPREMDLPDPGLSFTVLEGEDVYRIELHTRCLAKGVYLSFGEIAGVFSDNYFDMAPGTGKTVSFVTSSKIVDPSSSLKVRTLYGKIP